MTSATLTQTAQPTLNGKPANPTVEAVVRYADRLRREADPDSGGWWPTTAGALHVFEKQLVHVRLVYRIAADGTEDTELVRGVAARQTIAWMRRRTGSHETSAGSPAPSHQSRRAALEARDRRAKRDGLTAGQRVDQALAELADLAAAEAAQPTGGRVRDRESRVRAKVMETVKWVEDDLEAAKRRQVEKQRDTA